MGFGANVDGAMVVPMILLPIPFPATGLYLGIISPVESVRFIAERIWAAGGKHEN
jgi:hypothetical protein